MAKTIGGRLAQDDGAMKLVFDHVRNIGLTALVFTAAAWKMQFLKWSVPPIAIIDVLTILVLLGLGVFLWLVNTYSTRFPAKFAA
jgi:protein-S-isoprenylcysteine O-methyltransferase Ste14